VSPTGVAIRKSKNAAGTFPRSRFLVKTRCPNCNGGQPSGPANTHGGAVCAGASGSLERSDVPEADHLVGAAGGGEIAVGRERDADDFAGMPLEGLELFACRNVPEARHRAAIETGQRGATILGAGHLARLAVVGEVLFAPVAHALQLDVRDLVTRGEDRAAVT